MNRKNLLTAALTAALGLGVAAGSFVVAAPSKEAKLAKQGRPAAAAPAAAVQPEMKLPPGWTEADMQACMAAGTPGKMHEFLAQEAGVWHGKSSMWMPGASEPMVSDCTMNVTTMWDGRYVRGEMSGDMPGMGPFQGMGLKGFDNVSQKFVGAWADSQSTGIMNGTGELSKDGKTIKWNFTHNCPITKKPTSMRQVETVHGPDSRTLEMFGPDAKTGKEFKMMRIELTRKPSAEARAGRTK